MGHNHGSKIPAPTDEEIAQHRLKIRGILQSAMDEAAVTGKPPLIFVGESHSSIESQLLELIIVQEAAKMGFRNAGVELPPEHANEPRTLKLSSVDMEYATTDYFTEFLGFNRHYVDDLRSDAGQKKIAHLPKDEQLNQRNLNMAKNLTPIAAPVIMITGSRHLSGFLADSTLKETYTVVSMRVNPDASEPAPAGTHVIRLQGDARELTFDSMTALALGSDTAKQFKAYLLNQKLLETKEESNRLAENFARPKHGDILGYQILSEALYNLGKSEEAGRVFAKIDQYCLIAPKKQEDECFDARYYADKERNFTFHEAREAEGIKLKISSQVYYRHEASNPKPLRNIISPREGDVTGTARN
ncbi:MAG: hypothetical protein K2X09_00870 [Rickettsiales bacterium]|nr:hypothetical protein [Rickettsiales bacterium]